MPVSEAIKLARQSRHDRRIAAASKNIPEGPYCYRVTGSPRAATQPDGSEQIRIPTETCRYYKIRKDKPAQQNGFCRLLKAGDWMPHPHGTMMLWDGCKECGINPG